MASFFMIHVVSCLFLFTAYEENFNHKTWVYHLTNNDYDKSDLYIVAYYWTVQSVATIGLGDIRINTIQELILCMFVIVIGAGFYSYIVGSIANIFASQGTKDSYITYKKTIMDEFCKQASIDKNIKTRIQINLQYNADKSIFNQKDKNFFISQLPSNIKQQLSKNIFGDIQNQIFFQNKDSIFISETILLMTPVKFKPGDTIYQQDRYPNAVYFIVKGRVNCQIDENNITFKNFGQDSYFGEIEIIQNNQVDNQKKSILRIFTTKAQIITEILSINEVDFLKLLNMFPDYYEEIKKLSIKRKYFIQLSMQKIKRIQKIPKYTDFWKEDRKFNLYQFIKQKKIGGPLEQQSQQQNIKHLGQIDESLQSSYDYDDRDEIESNIEPNHGQFKFQENKMTFESDDDYNTINIMKDFNKDQNMDTEQGFQEIYFKSQFQNQNEHIRNLEILFQEQKQLCDNLFQKIDNVEQQLKSNLDIFEKQFTKKQ